MRIAYFDCFSGVSGDMCLGAIVDAGVPPEKISRQLGGLKIGSFRLSARKVKRAGLAATKVDVRIAGRPGGARSWDELRAIIEKSKLPGGIRQQGADVFRRLFTAEARAHGTSLSNTHLHELSAADCVVDIFGTLVGLSLLGVEKVFASPVNVGSGLVATEHGFLPVPAPATARLLKGLPVYSSGVPHELTTPTGAALISTLAGSIIPLPPGRYDQIGIGAGDLQLPDRPNVLRLFVGEADRPRDADTVTVVETNIDDMNPQIYEQVFDRLFREGALDVFLSQVIMKKSRPGLKLTVLCPNDLTDRMTRILFEETTTIGVRSYRTARTTMERKTGTVMTPYGAVAVKVSRAGNIRKIAPEYDDCVRAARKHRVPVRLVLDAAAAAAGQVKKRD